MNKQTESNSLPLIESGKPVVVLAVDPPQDCEAIGDAVLLLRDHLRACIGQDLPWWRSDDSTSARLLLQLDPLATDLAADGFEMRVESTSCTLRSRTPGGMWCAVCHFLESAFGVRWLWPGESGCVTPHAINVRVPFGQARHEPDWHWRRLFLGGAFWKAEDPFMGEQSHGGLSPQTMRDWRSWQRHQRLEGLTIADGHRWCQICPPERYGQTHPEYFALVNGERDCSLFDGKHRNHACTSNEAVVKLTADYVIAVFRARPELDGFSIAMNDGKGLCECDKCRAIDAWAGERLQNDDVFERVTAEDDTKDAANMVGDAVITDRMLLFANQVAERVARVYPDKLLLTLIYGQYRTAPARVQLHPNVIAQFCSMTWQHVDPQLADREQRVLTDLAGRVDKVGIYDYFINGRNGSMQRGFASIVATAIPRYHATGCRYYASQAGTDFATNGFAYYLAARLLWDSNADMNSVLVDYCDSGFGAASEPVRCYLSAYIERWDSVGADLCATSPKMEDMVTQLYPHDWRQARRHNLEEARQLADSDPVRERIEFLLQGLTFLDLLVTACDAANGDSQSFQGALDKLLNWTDSHRDGFVFSAMWFDYQRLMRGGKLKPQ